MKRRKQGNSQIIECPETDNEDDDEDVRARRNEAKDELYEQIEMRLVDDLLMS